jgi:lipopolysaccharide transport system permease protein
MSTAVAVNKKDIVFFYTKAKLEDDVFDKHLGFVWWLLDPLLTALVYYLIFHVILHSGRERYLPFLVVGVIPWKWFSTSIKAGSDSILTQKSLYKKIYLPKIIFPWIEVSFLSAKFLIAIALISLIYPLIGFPLSTNYVFLPLVILCQFVFTLGLGTLLSSVTPFIPDLNILIAHALRLAFYPSGILFAADRVPDRLKFIMVYNPLAQAIDGYRNVIMYGKAPPMFGMLLLLSVGALFYGIGFLIIQKFEGKYAKLA